MTEPEIEKKPSRATRPIHGILVAAVVFVGAFIAYSPNFAPNLWGQSASPADTLTYVADLDYWQRTGREVQVVAKSRFDLDADLTDVPLTIGEWQGKEVPETNEEVMILLDPEQYVQRLYQHSDGRYIWLTMIGGRNSQPFHAPDICYDADGWQYNLSSKGIPLENGGEVHGLWMEAEKQFPGKEEMTEHIVFYFYLFPNRARELKDGIVLFKLTSGRYGTIEETLEMQAEFVREFFTQAGPAGGA